MSGFDKLWEVATSPFGAIANPATYLQAMTTPKEAAYVGAMMTIGTMKAWWAIAAPVGPTLVDGRIA